MRSRPEARLPANFVPAAYREVSVQPYSGGWDEAALTAHLIGRDAYRTTRFVLLEGADRSALVRVSRENSGSSPPLFSAIESAEVVALSERCHLVADPNVDVGNPTALARAAAANGFGAEDTVVVRGQDSHVNFIHRPEPTPIRVLDLVPPSPSKLARVAAEALAYRNLPAAELRLETLDVRELAREATPAETLLIPCRASGLDFDQKTLFLDERPAKQDWVLLGCERSRQIHHHFYGDTPESIETCPRSRLAADDPPTLLRCCLLEEGIEREGPHAIVPWGATHSQVEEALTELLEERDDG